MPVLVQGIITQVKEEPKNHKADTPQILSSHFHKSVDASHTAYGKNISGKDNTRQIGSSCPPHVPGLLRQLLLLPSSDRWSFIYFPFWGEEGKDTKQNLSEDSNYRGNKPIMLSRFPFCKGNKKVTTAYRNCGLRCFSLAEGGISQPDFLW